MSDAWAVARRCLSSALGRELEVEEAPVRGTTGDWDSLKHVELMFVIEDETGCIMTPDQLASIVDLDTLAEVLSELSGDS